MTRKIVLLFLVLAVFLTNTLRAEKRIEITSDISEYKIGKYLEIYEDKTGKLTFEEIKKENYQKDFILSQKEIPNFGVSKSTYWIRFKLKNNSRTKEELFLATFPTYKHIAVYGHFKNGQIWNKKSGHAYPDSTRDVNHRQFTFRFNLEAQQEMEIYVEVKSYFASTFPFILYKHQYFHEIIKWDTVFYSAWFGAMVLIVLFNFFSWIFFKDRNQIRILFFTVFFVCFTLTAEGFLEKSFIINFLHPFSTLTFISFVSFTRYFLKTKNNLPRLDMGLIFLNGISFIILIFSSILGPTQIFTLAVNLQNAVQNITLLIIGILSLKKEFVQARNFLIGFSFLLLAAFAYEMRIVGILPGNFLTLHGIQIAAFFFALFIYFSLIDQFIQNKKEKEKMQANLIEVMEQKLDESQKVASLSTQLQELNLSLEKTVEKRTKELSVTNQKLIQVNNLKNEFVGIVIHDMKTPLIGIKILAELISDEKLEKNKIQDLTTAIHKSSVYMLSSIQKMLDLNALEKGNVLRNSTIFDLRAVIAQSISLVQPLSDEKRIQMQQISKGSYFETSSNQVALEKIVENLLSNSIRHSPNKSTIRIKLQEITKEQNKKTKKITRSFKITIQNENIDFSKEKLNQILEKVFTKELENSFIPDKGLLIARYLAKTIGWSMDVKITKRFVVSKIWSISKKS